MRQFRISLLLIATLLIVVGAARAQEEAPPGIEFSFSNPGARSMGFGGAFVALADDATAAFANPAGLVQLVKPEVSVEGRYWDYSTPYVEGGRGFGPATGRGLDVSPGLRIGTSSHDLSGLSFLSLVYPRDNWSLAFYRHQLADYEFVGETEALFFGPWPGFPESRARSWDYRKGIDLEIASYGVSGALRVSDRVSLGLGVSYFESNLSMLLESFDIFNPDGPADWWSARSYFAPEQLVESQTLVTDDTAWGFLAGLLWRVSERWSLGAVFRQGPEVEGFSMRRAGPLHWSQPAGAVVASETGRFPLPDVVGLGASFRSRNERLTVGFEWDRVRYSDILAAADPELVLEDGDELHLGAEYVFLGSAPMAALRLGVWHDPVHRIGYRGGDYVAAAILQPGSDELHVAAGLGLAFRRFQLDLGVDLSELVDTASLSTIYSF